MRDPRYDILFEPVKIGPHTAYRPRRGMNGQSRVTTN